MPQGSSHTLGRRVAPFAPLALALLMQNAVLNPLQTGEPTSEEAILAVAHCDDVEDSRDCHTRFPTGCTTGGDYDTYLNLLKNQLIVPGNSAPLTFFTSKAEVVNLDEQVQAFPTKLTKGNHLDLKDSLAAMGEGQLRGVVGFLYSVKPETGGTGETSNCKLHGNEEDVDFHIGIGFDQTLAQRIRTAAANHKQLSAQDRTEIRQTILIVEMTPHYRGRFHPDDWTSGALKQVLGRQVKVVGQLLADNEHNIRSQNCALPGATDDCWRATIWELHPVTRFQVCKSSDSCDLNSNDWAELSEVAQ